MIKYNYENISNMLNEKINKKLDKLNDLSTKGMITKTEKQYLFLTFLQSLSLSDNETFNVYTNTEL